MSPLRWDGRRTYDFNEGQITLSSSRRMEYNHKKSSDDDGDDVRLQYYSCMHHKGECRCERLAHSDSFSPATTRTRTRPDKLIGRCRFNDTNTFSRDSNDHGVIFRMWLRTWWCNDSSPLIAINRSRLLSFQSGARLSCSLHPTRDRHLSSHSKSRPAILK